MEAEEVDGYLQPVDMAPLGEGLNNSNKKGAKVPEINDKLTKKPQERQTDIDLAMWDRYTELGVTPPKLPLMKDTML